MRDRPVTVAELAAVVLPLARIIGELANRIAALEADRAEADAKITPDRPTRGGPK